MEHALLHPTRDSRFYAAKRLRLQNAYAYWAQIVCSVCLIFWSLRPAFGWTSAVNLEFYAAFSSIAILAMTLAQQAAGYIDQARSLEASARRIDALRRDLTADMSEGKGNDPRAIRIAGRKYSKILEEFPVNHTSLDYKYRAGGFGAACIMHVRAGVLSVAVTMAVVSAPLAF